jgi:hypothetical protein
LFRLALINSGDYIPRNREIYGCVKRLVYEVSGSSAAFRIFEQYLLKRLRYFECMEFCAHEKIVASTVIGNSEQRVVYGTTCQIDAGSLISISWSLF